MAVFRQVGNQRPCPRLPTRRALAAAVGGAVGGVQVGLDLGGAQGRVGLGPQPRDHRGGVLQLPLPAEGLPAAALPSGQLLGLALRRERALKLRARSWAA